MAGSDVKRKARELLDYGIPKQQVFDILSAEFPAAKPKQVAEELRFMPELAARERYGGLHRALLAAVVLYAGLRVARPLLAPDFDWNSTYRLIGLVPIATLLLGYSLYRWQGRVFQWVGWLNALGAMGMLKEWGAWLGGKGEPWSVAISTASVAIGALSLYLAHRVFAKPRKVEDPARPGTPRYLFPEVHPL